MSFDLEAFKSKLEELKSSVAYTETGEICPDVHEVCSVLKQLKETLPIRRGNVRFTTAHFMSLLKDGMDMDEAFMVLQDYLAFDEKLNDKLTELKDAAIHQLNSQ